MLNKKTSTQAIIIIHGIGEQRPMETVRQFADAVLPDPKEGDEKFFSKPDKLSESFELRKLQNRRQPRTHIYEYYWAYKIEGSDVSHVLSWLSTLLLRLPWNIPAHLRALFLASWVLIGAAAAAILLGVLDSISEFTTQFPTLLITAISTVLFGALQFFVLRYVGDAARYLSPTPRNIKLRHEIRADGIKLLKELHQSGKYERIILVGHSLGSIIAYDILNYLWQDYHDVYLNPIMPPQAVPESAENNDHLARTPDESGSLPKAKLVKLPQPALERAEEAGLTLTPDQDGKVPEVQLKRYRECQLELWKEQRQYGNPWLVTDLITAASPLAHAALLLARDEADMNLRKRQRELPTNPPIYEFDKESHAWRFSFRLRKEYPGNVRLRAIHHAGLFGCTRWTNLYYPVRYGFFGDLVGGPLQKWFGNGVNDVPVTSHTFLLRNSLWAHTSYWRKEDANQSPKNGLSLALQALIKALDLCADSLFASGGTANPASDSDEDADD